MESKNKYRPCIKCGYVEVEKIRKALFRCKHCGQEYISDEKDMKG